MIFLHVKRIHSVSFELLGSLSEACKCSCCPSLIHWMLLLCPDEGQWAEPLCHEGDFSSRGERGVGWCFVFVPIWWRHSTQAEFKRMRQQYIKKMLQGHNSHTHNMHVNKVTKRFKTIHTYKYRGCRRKSFELEGVHEFQYTFSYTMVTTKI